MSGCKVGTAVTYAAQESLLNSAIEVGIASLSLGLTGATQLTGLGAKIFIKSTLGLGKKLYNKVDEALENKIKEETEIINRNIEKLFKTQKDVIPKDDKEQIDFKLNINDASNTNLEKLRGFFTDKLQKLETAWLDYENANSLRNKPSRSISELSKRISKLISQPADKARTQHISKSSFQEDTDEKKLKYIEERCVFLQRLYPQQVQKIINAIGSIRGGEKRLADLEKWEEFKKLKSKWRALEESEEKRRTIQRLFSIQTKYFANPIFVSCSKYEEAKRQFERCVDRVFEPNFQESELEKLKKTLAEFMKEAKQEDRKKRFEEMKKKIIESLRNRNYSSYKETELKEYLKIEAKQQSGKKAIVELLKPDVEEDLPVIKIEIDQSGYNKKEEWEQEGRELAKEISSQGILLNFEETMTHFKGEVLEEGIRYLERLLGNNAKVKKINQTRIRIKTGEGQEIEIDWIPSISVEKIVENVRGSAKETELTTAVTRERLREEEG